MRALHLFPCFSGSQIGGSDYYQTELTRGLINRGVEVEVLASQSKRPRQIAGFSINWPTEVGAGPENLIGANVRRYRSLYSHRLFGQPASTIVTKRLNRELGSGFSPEIEIESFRECARTRPYFYDWLAMIGRGPISPGLIVRALRSGGSADVILGGFCPFSLLPLGAWIAKRVNKPFVSLPLFHPEDRYHHFESFFRCFKTSKAVLTQTPYSTHLLQRLVPGSRTVEIGVGINESEFEDGKVEGSRFRQRYGLQDKKIVLLVGRKEHHKNYKIAVNAIERLNDKSVVLVMIGADVDGVEIKSNFVRYLGLLPREDLLDAYDACNVFIFPSSFESFGIVLLEAWIRAKPVLGNLESGPVASIIDNGVDGYLCTSAADYASRVKQLIDNPNQSNKLGRNGREKVLNRYTWSKISGRVHDLYTEIVSHAPT